MESREPGLLRIGQIAIVVREMGRATAFYRDALGLRFLFEYPGLAFFECGGVRLMLTLPEKDKPELDPPGSILYFQVSDIEASADEMERRGVPFDQKPHFIARMPDHDLWLASFHDPEGNLLALMSEKKRPE